MIFSTGNSSLSSILLSIFVVSMYNITVANALLLRSGRTSGLFALRYGSTLKKTSSACTRILSPYSSVSSLNIISSARSVNGYRTPRESLCCGLDVYGRQSSTLAASEKDDSHTSKRVGVGSIKHTTTNSTFYDLSGTPAALSGLPDFSRPFTVLGIETSCDDTGVAIVRSDGKILSNIVMSQHKIHEEWGGVVPNLAMQEHKRNIDAAVADALRAAGLQSAAEVDAISVTQGPGLEVCLRVGIRKAQELARTYNKPYVMTHHLEGHCLVARLEGGKKAAPGAAASSDSVPHSKQPSIDQATTKDPIFSKGLPCTGGFVPAVRYPYLALLASGGHTSLVVAKGLGRYEVIGGTLDDAVGEAFDKTSRLLNISQGGAALEQRARRGRPDVYPLPIPMQAVQSCDFSYSGLKNSVRLTIEKLHQSGQMNDAAIDDVCASFQRSSFEHVRARVNRALDYVRYKKIPVSALVVVGGVAANEKLRSTLSELLAVRSDTRIKLVCPPPSLCTDNGVMAAWAGVEKLLEGWSDALEPQAEPITRWALGRPIDRGNSSDAVFREMNAAMKSRARKAQQLGRKNAFGNNARANPGDSVRKGPERNGN